MAPELCIEAIQSHQFGMGAPLHHTALLKHHYLISLADGAESVRHGKHGEATGGAGFFTNISSKRFFERAATRECRSHVSLPLGCFCCHNPIALQNLLVSP